LVLLVFTSIIVCSLRMRHAYYVKLSTYRTADERIWLFGEWLTGGILIALTLFTADLTLGQVCGARSTGICLPALHAYNGDQIIAYYGAMMKATAALAMSLGLYVIDRDLFAYF
jgi:hypothetical protein